MCLQKWGLRYLAHHDNRSRHPVCIPSGSRRLLAEVGFEEVAATTEKPHLAFRHEPTDLLIVLPPYRKNAAVALHHLVYVRTMLDGQGLMDTEEFDRLAGGLPAPRSASS
ncbi:MAG TPA: hypothetical protein VFA18_06270 [Gemmataceae bacterium]|nr:hypothetical protein [Gemmataceae bacterium]